MNSASITPRSQANRGTARRRKAVACVAMAALLAPLVPLSADARLKARTAAGEVAVAGAGQGRQHGSAKRLAKKKGHHQRRLKGSGRVSKKVRPKGKQPRSQEAVACYEEFEKAKENAGALHLRTAKEWFGKCSRSECPDVLKNECADFVRQVDAVMPSVIPVVEDAPASALSAIEVKMDGELLATDLDGRAVIVDPGEHVFSFVREGEAIATRKLTIEQGQRNRVVSVSLPSAARRRNVDLAPRKVIEKAAVHETAEAPRSPARTVARQESDAEENAGEEPRPARKAVARQEGDDDENAGDKSEKEIPTLTRKRLGARPSVDLEQNTGAPWPAYAFAGLGVLGVGGYGALTLRGRAENDALARSCKPNCMQSSVDHVKKVYLYADISLAIGVGALLASTYYFLRSPDREEMAARSQKSHLSAITIEPTVSGAVATVGGSF